MRKSVICFAVVAVLSTQSFGFGYHDSITKGSIIPGLTPLTVALGSIRALEVAEAAGMFCNPAQTALLSGEIQFSGSAIQWAERVIQTDIEKMVRTMLTNDNGVACVVIPQGPVVVGAGIAKVGEFGYEGAHTVYDNPDESELGVAVLYADGSQLETLISISAVVGESFSAGFSGGVRMTNADYLYKFNSHKFSIPDSSAAWSIENNEFAWHAGLATNGEMFKSAISYSSRTEYMNDIIAFGASALAPHLNNITVGFEAQVASPFNDNNFMGNLFFRIPFASNMSALTSVSFDDSRVANRAGLGFGMGVDYRVKNFDISCGFLSRFKARKNTAFPGEYSDRVDDASTMISFGVSYLWAVD